MATVSDKINEIHYKPGISPAKIEILIKTPWSVEMPEYWQVINIKRCPKIFECMSDSVPEDLLACPVIISDLDLGTHTRKLVVDVDNLPEWLKPDKGPYTREGI